MITTVSPITTRVFFSPLEKGVGGIEGRNQEAGEPGSHYNKSLKSLARHLRKDSTKAEIILWDNVLGAKKFYGYQFNRQFPIDDYIVDFVSRKLKWVIELDGESHENRLEKDKRKDDDLTRLGYRVIRIMNEDVINNLDGVVEHLETLLARVQSPQPPSPRGRERGIR